MNLIPGSLKMTKPFFSFLVVHFIYFLATVFYISILYLYFQFCFFVIHYIYLMAPMIPATITRTAYYYRSFAVSGLNLWNSLPKHIKECTSLSSFKRSLYNHMVTKPVLNVFYHFTNFIHFNLCTYVYKYILSMNDLFNVYECLGHRK